MKDRGREEGSRGRAPRTRRRSSKRPSKCTTFSGDLFPNSEKLPVDVRLADFAAINNTAQRNHDASERSLTIEAYTNNGIISEDYFGSALTADGRSVFVARGVAELRSSAALCRQINATYWGSIARRNII